MTGSAAQGQFISIDDPQATKIKKANQLNWNEDTLKMPHRIRPSIISSFAPLLTNLREAEINETDVAEPEVEMIINPNGSLDDISMHPAGASMNSAYNHVDISVDALGYDNAIPYESFRSDDVMDIVEEPTDVPPSQNAPQRSSQVNHQIKL